MKELCHRHCHRPCSYCLSALPRTYTEGIQRKTLAVRPLWEEPFHPPPPPLHALPRPFRVYQKRHFSKCLRFMMALTDCRHTKVGSHFSPSMSSSIERRPPNCQTSLFEVTMAPSSPLEPLVCRTNFHGADPIKSFRGCKEYTFAWEAQHN